MIQILCDLIRFVEMYISWSNLCMLWFIDNLISRTYSKRKWCRTSPPETHLEDVWRFGLRIYFLYRVVQESWNNKEDLVFLWHTLVQLDVDWSAPVCVEEGAGGNNWSSGLWSKLICESQWENQFRLRIFSSRSESSKSIFFQLT